MKKSPHIRSARKDSRTTIQAAHFDTSSNQYSEKHILTPPPHTKVEIEQVLKEINQSKTTPVLDFGSGTGRLTIPLLQNGYKVDAVDISAKSLQVLKQTCHRLGYLKDLRTFTKIPQGQKYQTVCGSDILHHVDLVRTFQIFADHLHPKGKVIFSEPGGLNPFWNIFLRYFYQWDIEKGITECTIRRLQTVLQDSGMKRIKIKGVGFLPRSFFSFSTTCINITDYVGSLPLIRHFAYRYIISAERQR